MYELKYKNNYFNIYIVYIWFEIKSYKYFSYNMPEGLSGCSVHIEEYFRVLHFCTIQTVYYLYILRSKLS